MWFVFRAGTALVAGVALGLFATWLTVFHHSMPGGIDDGPWRTNLSIGSAASSPYTRASVALHGLLALNRSETIYYTAGADSAGNALDGDCRYEVAGRDPDTRWWSITAYAADDYLIPNAQNRYSVSKNSVVRAPDGSVSAAVGGTSPSQNWIPVGHGPFTLTLRLYNPSAGVAANPARAQLPAITKVACP
jgi:hypothetical protein